MRMTRALAVLTLLTALPITGTAVAQGAAPATAHPLPLGPGSLAEHRTSRTLAPGVTYTRIVRGYESRDYYSVEVGDFQTQAEAKAAAAKVVAGGHRANVWRIDKRPQDDPSPAPLLWVVRSGRYRTEAAATTALAAIGTGKVVYSGEDGLPSTGPWVVNVLRVSKRFTGRITNELATGVVPGRETPSHIARRTGAIAATNGSFFVITPGTGYLGDIEGTSIVDGQLVSEAINGKSAMLLPGGTPVVGRLTSRLTARSSDGATTIVDGRDRPNGEVFGCGGVGGDKPTQRPLATYSCTDASEIIQYLPQFGARTPAGKGYEVVLDAHGRVTGTRAQGGPIPRHGSTLVGTGTGAQWLRVHARVGAKVAVSVKVTDSGQVVRLGGHPGAVAGGPGLVHNGAVDATGQADGFNWPDYGALWWSFGDRRNPRTMAGTTANGDFLLVAVDGHAPGYSIGLSVDEEARVMHELGAMQAINLDGGGSTSMALDGKVVNRPSDDAGERPVGDAVVILPKGR